MSAKSSEYFSKYYKNNKYENTKMQKTDKAKKTYLIDNEH